MTSSCKKRQTTLVPGSGSPQGLYILFIYSCLVIYQLFTLFSVISIHCLSLLLYLKLSLTVFIRAEPQLITSRCQVQNSTAPLTKMTSSI